MYRTIGYTWICAHALCSRITLLIYTCFVLLIDNFSSIDLWVEIKKWNLYSDVVFF